MTDETPFVDPDTRELDLTQIRFEAVPIAKLLGLFVAVALVPMVLALLLGPIGPAGGLLALLAQFVLAVGGAVVLLYVIVRARELGSA